MRMVINEIAEAAGVSVPSVTRLARRLGYKGFLDFRVALAGVLRRGAEYCRQKARVHMRRIGAAGKGHGA